MARVGVDLHIFEILNNSPNSKTVAEMAGQAGASPDLMGIRFIVEDIMISADSSRSANSEISRFRGYDQRNSKGPLWFN